MNIKQFNIAPTRKPDTTNPYSLDNSPAVPVIKHP